jgi:hypothetical protein
VPKFETPAINGGPARGAYVFTLHAAKGTKAKATCIWNGTTHSAVSVDAERDLARVWSVPVRQTVRLCAVPCASASYMR